MEPKPKCSARRSNGQPCNRWPCKGQRVCPTHGGRAPQAIEAAKRRLAEAKAAKVMVTYGLPIDVDPKDALLDELRRTAGHVAWLLEQVQALSPEALVWSVVEEVNKTATDFPGIDITKAARPHVYLTLYRDERKHYLAVAKAAIDAGIEERRVRLVEQSAAQVVTVIRAALDAAGVTGEQRAAALGEAQRQIGLLAGGAAGG